MANCHSCGAEIVWCRTVTGKASPMERADDGTWIIVDGVMRRPVGELDDMLPRYKSHFATCKDAAKWRKAR